MRALVYLLCGYLSLFTLAHLAVAEPNIVLILVDDMGYGDPGCFNPESKIPTPNIDSLARDGMRFTDAHAPGPLCHMSRYGLLTGRYPFRIDVSVWPNRPLIEPKQPTIASLAKRAGYATAMIGKWHLGFDEQGYDQPLRGGPVDCGFDRFFGIRASTDIPPYFYIRDDQAVSPPTDHIAASHSPDWSPIQGRFWRAGGIAPDLQLKDVLPRFTDEAISVIEDHAKKSQFDQPLMLYLAYPAPHTPWLPDEEFVGKSGAGTYGDFVAMVDAEIGRVLDALDQANMAEDTLLVFTSDNGPAWRAEDAARFVHECAGKFRGMKGDAWEGGHRMPMVVRWPGRVEPNSSSDQLVCFTDFLATLADVMGTQLPVGAGPDSVSFLPTLLGRLSDDSAMRQQVVIQAGSLPSMMTIRHGAWKLITQLGSGGFSKPKYVSPSLGGPTGQLYNLKNDPGEMENLFQAHPQKVAQLANQLKEVVDEEVATTVTVIEGDVVDSSTLTGKVICGYQGWFNCEGDGADLGWFHWASDKEFKPETLKVDLWPDVSEFDADELYETGFKHADGSTGKVFSSRDQKTVARHFRWMQQYGIDGAFLQRFASELPHERRLENRNVVLENVRTGAKQAGRTYALMYDLSGLKAGEVKIVQEDWTTLRETLHLTKDKAYQHHEGKPVVAVWGVGFGTEHKPREYSLQECRELVEFLKADGCTVMLGVPTGWRKLERDANSDSQLHEVLQLADIVSPWTVGRYRNEEEIARHAKEYWRIDNRWCKQRDLDYMPVVFPGFSWHNLNQGELDQIPRQKGEFLWSQILAIKAARCDMLYVAMFDEVDEGTAIFKCTNDPPTANGAKLIGFEGLPSDFYLDLVGKAGKVLRGEIPRTKEIP